jgi:transposase
MDRAEQAGIARHLHRCQACQSRSEDADNKSDRNDAVGIARIMQCGWYKEVRVKDLDSHAIKTLLVSRALLVKIKRDLENQVRGLLKNLGLVIGRAKMNVFAARAAELIEDRPELTAAVVPLLKTREVIERQIADLDRKVLRLARNNTQVRRRRLCRIDDPKISFWRDRLDWTHLEMWRCDVANLPI